MRKNNSRFISGNEVSECYSEDGNNVKEFKLQSNGYVINKKHINNTFNQFSEIEEKYLYTDNTNFKDNSYDSTIIAYDGKKLFDPLNIKENEENPFEVMNIHYDRWEEFYYDLLLSEWNEYEFFKDNNLYNKMEDHELFYFDTILYEDSLHISSIMESVTGVCKDNSKYTHEDVKKTVNIITKEYIDKLSNFRKDVLDNNNPKEENEDGK